MTLILSNQEIDKLLVMSECIDVLDSTYKELADGRGITRRRSDCLAPTTRSDAVYGLKSMDGVVPSLQVGAVRINSDIITWPRTGAHRRRVKIPAAENQRYVGLILLFSTANGEPLAIFPDGVVQRMRVGATNGLGIKYMARADATTVGILGSGWQAGAQLMAACAVRDISSVKCFSPNPANRAAFARQMSETLGIDVVAVETPEAAVDGVDIAICATNVNSKIYGPEWMKPGMHVTSLKHVEIDSAAVKLADKVFVHTKDPSPTHCIAENLEALPSRYTAKGWADIDELDFASLPELTELVSGKRKGRDNDAQITCFINNFGLGYQFAGVGALVYNRAKQAEVGIHLPTDWFTQDVHP